MRTIFLCVRFVFFLFQFDCILKFCFFLGIFVFNYCCEKDCIFLIVFNLFCLFFLFFHCTSSIENISKFGFTADRINSTIQKERKKKVVCQIVWLLWQKANFQPKPTKSTRSETYSYTDTVAVWFYSLLVKICYCCCWFFLFVGFPYTRCHLQFHLIMSINRAPKSGFAAEAQRKVCKCIFIWFSLRSFIFFSFFPFFSLYLVYSFLFLFVVVI